MKGQSATCFLLADVGGTHVRLAQSTDSASELLHVRKYSCSDYSSLEEIVRDYLQSHPLAGDVSACFAVAAPVSEDSVVDQVEMTNRDWRFSVSQLKEEFGWQSLEVINDFEAIARAVPCLQRSQLVQLGGGNVDPQGRIVVLGPGTGLGVKHLLPTLRGFKVLSGEGGHVDFAPVDEQDLIIWRYIHKHQSRVSMEDVLSGRGLVNIYKALAEAQDKDEAFDDAASIVRAAQNSACDVCSESLLQLCRILGSFAGNLALTLNTTGGVYLCGGVLTELRDLLQQSDFRMRFESKGRFESYVKDIPAFLITANEPGLRGALAYLQS